MKTRKKKSPSRPGVRSLKIQPKHRPLRGWGNSVVPQLILCGRWMEDIGFEKESRVVIHTSKDLIVIQPETPEE